VDLHLHLSPELEADVRELLPHLERLQVSSLSVSSYSRPGEPRFWLAYVYVDGRRHVRSTVERAGQPLVEQWPALLSQLIEFNPRGSVSAWADFFDDPRVAPSPFLADRAPDRD
jgi:hypothetical protein